MRCATLFNQALFALNRQWFVNDKTAMEELAAMSNCPPGYVFDVDRLLGEPGHDAASLVASVDEAERLFRSILALDGVDVPLRFLA